MTTPDAVPERGAPTSGASTGTAPGARAPVQVVALVFGIVFLAVGVLGFIPGVTSDYSSLGFAMSDSRAKLLGLFQVSVLHNIVHLLFGVIGVAAARVPRAARGYLIIGGIVYLVIFLYGVVVPMDSAANFVPLNAADNVLHIVLAVVMVVLGVVLGRRVVTGAGAGVR